MFSHPLAQASCRAQYPALSRWFTSQILFSKQYKTTSCGEQRGTAVSPPHNAPGQGGRGTHPWVREHV